jgi:predicted NUDIX family phosphoesterase
MSKEKVLVFPASVLESRLPAFAHGLLTDPAAIKQLLDEALDPQVAFYMDRDQAEQDPGFKQVIPYVVLIGNMGGEDSYLAYRRTSKGGETRLHGLWSVGVGGHINPGDGEVGLNSYEEAFYRELFEEVSISREICPRAPVHAVIYDDSNDVGCVHLGVVHFVKLPATRVTFRDPALDDGYFALPHKLKSLLSNFENWSKLVIEHLL